MDEYTRREQRRAAQMAGAMAKVGVALLALPLDELPPIAHMQLRHDSLSEGLRVELQLGGACTTAAGLRAWAAALPEPAVAAKETQDYVRVEVVSVLDGVTVAVWDHIRGRDMGDAVRLLGLPLDRQTHAVPLAALRELAAHAAADEPATTRESAHA